MRTDTQAHQVFLHAQKEWSGSFLKTRLKSPNHSYLYLNNYSYKVIALSKHYFYQLDLLSSLGSDLGDNVRLQYEGKSPRIYDVKGTLEP